MREIKFRAWDPSRHKFHAGNMSNVMLGLSGMTFWQFGNEAPEPIPEKYIVQQYTGLKDKNGVEIYEDDIVRYYNSMKMWLTGKVVNVGGAFAVITAENPILLYEFQHNYIYDSSPIPELEVIGNIHENPELIA